MKYLIPVLMLMLCGCGPATSVKPDRSDGTYPAKVTGRATAKFDGVVKHQLEITLNRSSETEVVMITVTKNEWLAIKEGEKIVVEYAKIPGSQYGRRYQLAGRFVKAEQ